MLISASRRTDIPAFYTEWFIRRIRAGYCKVVNPFNPQQTTHVDLTPPAVDVIVFWTRNPSPLMRYLDEFDERGYRYYFQYTLLDHPHLVEPHLPPLEKSLETFHALAAKIGAARLIWRYDPILLSPATDVDYHVNAYGRIARALRGAACRSVISLMDFYPKITPRLKQLAAQGIQPYNTEQISVRLADLMPPLVELAQQNGMEMVSCAEEFDLLPYGVRPGKCIDDGYIQKTFGIQVTQHKDPHQRPQCGCVTSKDIGAYDTCLFGCAYCYATSSLKRAQTRHACHNPEAEAL